MYRVLTEPNVQNTDLMAKIRIRQTIQCEGISGLWNVQKIKPPIEINVELQAVNQYDTGERKNSSF